MTKVIKCIPRSSSRSQYISSLLSGQYSDPNATVIYRSFSAEEKVCFESQAGMQDDPMLQISNAHPDALELAL